MFDTFIEEVASKYGYSDELIEALKRVLPIMIDGKDEEEIQLLKDTLERVPIFIFDKQLTKEDIDRIKESLIKGRNNHITEIDIDRGEYDKSEMVAAYDSYPIFDERMNIIDRVGFIYLTRLPEYRKTAQYYNTRIDISALIHELGHAWGAQKDEYEQYEDGSYVQRIGMIKSKFEVDRNSKTTKGIEETGLYIEEALNTIEQEKVLYKLFEINDYKKIPGFLPSNYQGLMTRLMRTYLTILGDKGFVDYRLKKDESIIDNYQSLFERTKFSTETYKNPEYFIEKEREIQSFEKTKMIDDAKKRVREFFSKYHSLYFEPQSETIGFYSHLDNVLKQLYSLVSIKLMYFYEDEKEKPEEGYIKMADAYHNMITSILSEGSIPLGEITALSKEVELEQKEHGVITLKSIAKEVKERIVNNNNMYPG